LKYFISFLSESHVTIPGYKLHFIVSGLLQTRNIQKYA